MDTDHSMETGNDRKNVCTDVRILFCGADRGEVAPCTYCEWCGICPQHPDREDE